jgi:hypothetical protein
MFIDEEHSEVSLMPRYLIFNSNALFQHKHVLLCIVLSIFNGCENTQPQHETVSFSKPVRSSHSTPKMPAVELPPGVLFKQDLNKSYHSIKKPWVMAKPMHDTNSSLLKID